MRVLALVPDGYWGHGGIALYLRDFLSALSELPECEEIVALARNAAPERAPLPPKLSYITDSSGGKVRYVGAALRTVRGGKKFDVIVCGHLQLLPLALALRAWTRGPLVVLLYGIEAWSPRGAITRLLLRGVSRFVSISRITSSRFADWSGTDPETIAVIPNAIHLESYGAGVKSAALLDRYGLHGKTVLMTLGRIDARERYKGFDEILEVLPELALRIPDVAYVIAGDGSDRPRLEEKARALGVEARVVFTGLVPESEKAELLRLADAFVMPGHGEGFGFVFLEALACGVPVVASSIDGSREAVRDGMLGVVVDPRDRSAVLDGVLKALAAPRGEVPEGLGYFEYPAFSRRVQALFANGSTVRGETAGAGYRP